MAWISVHEQVIGKKLRSLAKEIGCSQNEALGLLVRLWLWGINNADKEGRIVGADKDDIAEMLTAGIGSGIYPENAVDAMISTGWIDDESGLYIHDWSEWQEQWYKAIKIREDAARRKRAERERKRSAASEQKPDAEKQDLPSPKLNVLPEEPVRAAPAYTKDFEEFWKIYPRHVGKGEAYKKYKARLNDGWRESELLEAATAYAEKCSRERTEQQYIKHPKTFLSESTPFADYIKSTDSKEEHHDVSDDDPFKDWRQ